MEEFFGKKYVLTKHENFEDYLSHIGTMLIYFCCIKKRVKCLDLDRFLISKNLHIMFMLIATFGCMFVRSKWTVCNEICFINITC